MKANTDDDYMRSATALGKAVERFAKAYVKQAKQYHYIRGGSPKKIRDEAYAITRAAIARAVPEVVATP